MGTPEIRTYSYFIFPVGIYYSQQIMRKLCIVWKKRIIDLSFIGHYLVPEEIETYSVENKLYSLMDGYIFL